MVTILQTPFSDWFSSMKFFVFWFKVHWKLFPVVQLTIRQYGFRQWLNAEQAASHFMNQWCFLLMHIYIRQNNIATLLQIMAWRLFGTKPLSETMLPYCQLDHKEHISVKFYFKFKSFYSRKRTWKCHLRNGSNFVLASMCVKSSCKWLMNLEQCIHRCIWNHRIV